MFDSAAFPKLQKRYAPFLAEQRRRPAMPWSNNHLPKYRKHRASGQAVVMLNGRDFYLGPHVTKASKLECDRLMDEWLAGGRSYRRGGPNKRLAPARVAG
jgi:hypothetical protein